ncbi:MAG TPA: PilW family protein [Steroidobacteraceae bacterium]|nr:PilW family protein [Steroidobacteraceae bacterium]
MSARTSNERRAPARCAARQRGLSLIELMVAILIALFLIAGIIVVEQGVNLSYSQQNGLSQLQDEERFAMSVLTSVIGTAGYFPDPTTNSMATALPASGLFGTTGQGIYAPNSSASAPHDSIYVRYMTAAGDGINLCDGTAAGNNVNTSYLYVAADPTSGNDLYCQLNGNSVPLVNGVTDMVILYGVATGADNNVTEYLTAQQVTAGGYWPNVTSVQVTLTFVNPMYTQSGQVVAGQPATVSFTRVISVMGRVGTSQ